ncbi:MAG: hypothetical protein H7318_14225 [Oligoflexus sp.]|nr:hypothetical protein [Oligoflexus sp.]
MSTENKTTRTCKKCGETKSEEDFTVKQNTCKSCKNKYAAKYRDRKKEKIAADSKRRYAGHKEEVAAHNKRYYVDHKEIIKAVRMRRKEQKAAYDKAYDAKNNKKKSARVRRRYNTNNLIRFKSIARCAVQGAFRRKGWRKSSKTQKLLGVSIEEALIILKERFLNLYGEELQSFEWVHLDHILPISLGESEDEIAYLSGIWNFQLLMAKDNGHKSDNLEYTINGKEYKVDLTPLLEFRATRLRREA